MQRTNINTSSYTLWLSCLPLLLDERRLYTQDYEILNKLKSLCYIGIICLFKRCIFTGYQSATRTLVYKYDTFEVRFSRNRKFFVLIRVRNYKASLETPRQKYFLLLIADTCSVSAIRKHFSHNLPL